MEDFLNNCVDGVRLHESALCLKDIESLETKVIATGIMQVMGSQESHQASGSQMRMERIMIKGSQWNFPHA